MSSLPLLREIIISQKIILFTAQCVDQVLLSISAEKSASNLRSNQLFNQADKPDRYNILYIILYYTLYYIIYIYYNILQFLGPDCSQPVDGTTYTQGE